MQLKTGDLASGQKEDGCSSAGKEDKEIYQVGGEVGRGLVLRQNQRHLT